MKKKFKKNDDTGEVEEGYLVMEMKAGFLL